MNTQQTIAVEKLPMGTMPGAWHTHTHTRRYIDGNPLAIAGWQKLICTSKVLIIYFALAVII